MGDSTAISSGGDVVYAKDKAKAICGKIRTDKTMRLTLSNGEDSVSVGDYVRIVFQHSGHICLEKVEPK